MLILLVKIGINWMFSLARHEEVTTSYNTETKVENAVRFYVMKFCLIINLTRVVHKPSIVEKLNSLLPGHIALDKALDV